MNINPFELLKNAQKIQEQMGNFQEKLSSINAAGSAGGGMVEVDLNGNVEMTAIRIAPEAAADGDMELLQDLILSAYSNALEKIKQAINSEMGAIAGGLGGMPGFPGMGA